jgi:cytochrome b
MISRKWRRIATETAAVFVFRAGHALTTSTRKNCGALQTRMSRHRDHNPTGATA